jgi:hypothetical protein
VLWKWRLKPVAPFLLPLPLPLSVSPLPSACAPGPISDQDG